MVTVMQERADGSIRLDHTDRVSIMVEHEYCKSLKKFLERFEPTGALCGACSNAPGEVYRSKSTGALVCLSCETVMGLQNV